MCKGTIKSLLVVHALDWNRFVLIIIINPAHTKGSDSGPWNVGGVSRCQAVWQGNRLAWASGARGSICVNGTGFGAAIDRSTVETRQHARMCGLLHSHPLRGLGARPPRKRGLYEGLVMKVNF